MSLSPRLELSELRLFCYQAEFRRCPQAEFRRLPQAEFRRCPQVEFRRHPQVEFRRLPPVEFRRHPPVEFRRHCSYQQRGINLELQFETNPEEAQVTGLRWYSFKTEVVVIVMNFLIFFEFFVRTT